ncbi:hypothetical protein JAAARDRAFT_41220 [Jaapia argillacea MUCL 33604]|uniref:Uncharacterized protein n=1 Tax=Jaapia argillacea MUCL 33604 TaxID=933084 RepID=A0A067PC06_9AGAM|nr:hypothetical protein JAAARDRAFT_41220 [Jaapia argillacea MUCL 33604]
MDGPHLVALSIFVSYFILIAVLFRLIVKSLPVPRQNDAIRNRSRTFRVLTCLSFGHTWFYMFKYMRWSFVNYESSVAVHDPRVLYRITDWLLNTGLFEEAWALVCNGPMNWWWSEQLCLFTVGAWTIFIAIEGHKYGVKHVWAYMLLGQVVAISVASNLFYLALLGAMQGRRPLHSPRASPLLWISVLLSLATVGMSPYTSDKTFLPNLLTMHALLVIPLAFSPLHFPAYSIRVSTLASLVTVMALGLHLRTTLFALLSLPSPSRQSPLDFLVSAWEVLHSHPAQSSIGWDVIWTTVSFFLWAILSRPSMGNLGRLRGLFLFLLAWPGTLLGSVGFIAPYVLQG